MNKSLMRFTVRMSAYDKALKRVLIETAKSTAGKILISAAIASAIYEIIIR